MALVLGNRLPDAEEKGGVFRLCFWGSAVVLHDEWGAGWEMASVEQGCKSQCLLSPRVGPNYDFMYTVTFGDCLKAVYHLPPLCIRVWCEHVWVVLAE